ncbi:MAG TPA: hypothetical protein VN653_11410 [Anaerolineales bacterium]|jgi:hypothetical protein|nr:hypothetical protein [Anaerolineales bacterium]
MFDNLRESADSSFYEEEPNDLYKEPAPSSGKKAAAAPKKRRNNARFLGMTAQQRFIVSLMLMFTVCIMGTLAMFVMGRMSLF